MSRDKHASENVPEFGVDDGAAGVIDVLEDTAVLVHKMLEYIDETRKHALGMVVNKANFLMMVFHLMDMKPVLESFLEEADFLDTHPKWPPLQHLGRTLRDLCEFARRCSVRSRIFLLYSGSSLVDELNKHFSQLQDCLDRMLRSDSDLPVGLVNAIQTTKEKLMASNLLPEPCYSQLAQDISSHLSGSFHSHEPYATQILRKISHCLKMPEFEAAELKQELHDDVRKAESEGFEFLEILRKLDSFFCSAQILDERRKLASADSSLLLAGVSSIPSSFFCPITGSLMQEPVMVGEEGYTYERSAILKWFDAGHRTCPDTGKELKSLELVPNSKLRQAMDEFFDHTYQAQIVYMLQELRNPAKVTPIDRAVETLKRITELGPKYRQLIFSLDGIEPLVDLIKPSGPNIQKMILEILMDISAIGYEHKVAIIEAGAVAVLLGLLRKNPTDKYLVELLTDLSKVDAGKRAIVSEKGFMLIIASALNSTPPKERLLLRILLDNLCNDDSEMIMEAARCTIYDPLVSCLTHVEDKTKCEIMTAVLRSLNELNTTLLVNAGIIAPLLNSLQDGASEIVQLTMKLLARLSCTEENKVLISKAGAIPVLVKFLGHPLDQIKVDVTSILSNLASDTQNMQEIDSEGAVVRLFTMMKSKDTILQEYSLKTLEFMVRDSQTVRKSVVEMGMVPIFYVLLQGHNVSATCIKSILNILGHIARTCNESRPVLPSAENVKYLISLLETNAAMEEKEAVFSILEALLNAEGTESVSVYMDENLLTLCKDYLHGGNSRMKESAIVVLSKFVRLGVEDPGILSALSEGRILHASKAVIDDVSCSQRAKQLAAEILCLLSSRTPHLTVRRSPLQGCLAGMGFKKFKLCAVHHGKCNSRDSFCLVEAEAVPSLVNLIAEGGVRSAEWAVRALLTLVEEDGENAHNKGIDFLMRHGLFSPLLMLIGKDESSTEAALQMLERIFRVKRYRDAKHGNVGRSALMQAMSSGNTEARELAAKALTHLGMISADAIPYAGGCTPSTAESFST